MKRPIGAALTVFLGFLPVLATKAKADIDEVSQAPTYEASIKPLLEAHCTECHHPGGRKPDLSRFPFAWGEASQEDIVQKIVDQISGSKIRMPPGNRAKLTAPEVALIRDWLGGGLNP